MNSTDAIHHAALKLAQDIDKEILNKIQTESYMKRGWVKAPFTSDNFTWPFEHRIHDVAAWIHQNATGEYMIFGKEFWFQRKHDLTAFILKWG